MSASASQSRAYRLFMPTSCAASRLLVCVERNVVEDRVPVPAALAGRAEVLVDPRDVLREGYSGSK